MVATGQGISWRGLALPGSKLAAQSPEHDLRSRVVSASQSIPGANEIEVPLATRQRHQIVETPTEARQGEPGPSVLALLTISTGLAILILGVVWFVFFRT